MFWNTTADSLRHGNSDAHALRAADGRENSSRGNQHYGQYNGPSGTLGKFKGDVARSVFYMAIRYNNLAIVNGFPVSTVGELGDLVTLLDWHRNDPPDDFEMNRNNIVYTWQFNRNPFIDYPDLVEYIWGNQVGNAWDPSLSINEVSDLNIRLYPNPVKDKLYISGITNETLVEVFSVDGRKLSEVVINSDTSLTFNLNNGIYLLKMFSEGKTITKKIVVQ